MPARAGAMLSQEKGDGSLYFASAGGGWARDSPKRTVLILRCPVKGFLCWVDQKYREFGRELSEGEMDFFCNSFVGQITLLSVMVDSGVSYFVLRRDAKLVDRVSGLVQLLTGEPGVDPSGLIGKFNGASERVFYKTIDDLPPKAWRAIQRTGTFYGKLNIELEVA